MLSSVQLESYLDFVKQGSLVRKADPLSIVRSSVQVQNLASYQTLDRKVGGECSIAADEL